MRKVMRCLAVALVLGLLTSLFSLVPIKAAGTILINGLTAASGPVGSSQTIVGSGFAGNETVTIQFGTTTILTSPSVITAPLIGSWTATITVPETPSGAAYPITATGATSGVSAAVTFNVTPKIVVNLASALPGASVTVSGTGYTSFEPNIITNFDGITTVGSPQTATNLGSWTNTFTVPNISSGVHTIHAARPGGVDSTASFTVIATPKITMNVTRGIVGSPVTVSGTGFAAGETGINVDFGPNNQISSTTNANTSGAWTLQFNVPETHGGVYSIDASGTTTLAGAVPNITYTVTPSISISPQAEPAGTSVSVSGTGFGANENNIAISYDGADQGSNVRADANGSWSNTFTVPVSSGGSHSVSAHGPSTGASTVPAVVVLPPMRPAS